MTNEALALLIQQGDNDELIPVLWEKTNKLLFMLSAEAFSRNKEQLIRHGVELEDLNQESYNVLLGAVRAYDPEKGFVLVSYFSYQFKKLLHRLLSTSDTLDRSETKSLDEPLTTETDGCTLADIIEDPCSSSPYDHAELYGYYDTLYQALESLPNEDREVIRLMFFSDPKRTLRYQELAERLGGIPDYSARSKARLLLKSSREVKCTAGCGICIPMPTRHTSSPTVSQHSDTTFLAE